MKSGFGVVGVGRHLGGWGRYGVWCLVLRCGRVGLLMVDDELLDGSGHIAAARFQHRLDRTFAVKRKHPGQHIQRGSVVFRRIGLAMSCRQVENLLHGPRLVAAPADGPQLLIFIGT